MTELPAGLKEALAESYEIHRRVGSGGMASVYAATDLKHQRQVACKVLHPQIAATIGDRFISEIQIAANLQHPHILPVFDSGRKGPWWYYVMPLIAAGTLRERLDRTDSPSTIEALRIARELADALRTAHQAGIVHRDIKPENVLLSQGHALLADFGIAQREVSDHGVELTGTGVVLGTPKYMSPEQVGGELVDHRSDLYSLTCVLFEMIAGAPPFQGNRAAALAAAHLTKPPPTLSSLGVEAPPSLERLVATGLEKGPADRFPSAASLLEALDSAIQDLESLARGGAIARPTPNMGSLVSKLCNRWKQVNAFEAALRETWDQEPRKPQLYVIHGEEGNGHASLLERLVQTRVTDFAESISQTKARSVLRLSVPWPRGRDATVLERHLRIALFRELDPTYMGGDLSVERLASLSARRGSPVVVVDHAIRAVSWNVATESLLRWYVGRFWSALSDLPQQPQFLVFLNLVYEAAGPDLAWTQRLARGRRQQRVRSRMGRTLARTPTSCPVTVLDELGHVTIDDVKDWFARNGIYESEQLRTELAQSIFSGVTEKPMAAVESALTEIHSAFATEQAAQTGFVR